MSNDVILDQKHIKCGCGFDPKDCDIDITMTYYGGQVLFVDVTEKSHMIETIWTKDTLRNLIDLLESCYKEMY